jgi:hypothetical protein
MNFRKINVLAFSLLALNPLFSYAQLSNLFGSDKTVAEQRQDIIKKSDETLKQLYAIQPKAKEFGRKIRRICHV